VKAMNGQGTGMLKRMLLRESGPLLYMNLCFQNHIRTANACYKDAADLHAELEEYPQAIARYEEVANHSLGSALTKYSVKEYWLRASLCALAMKVFGLNTSRSQLMCSVRTLSLLVVICPSIPVKTRLSLPLGKQSLSTLLSKLLRLGTPKHLLEL
jgi:hypothetical protein